MKLIHITDTHFTQPGTTLYQLDPRARLDACVADINRYHGDADLCVITGDLAHWGELDAYRELRTCLEQLNVPLRLVVGNHDDRQTLLKVFPETPIDGNGFIQSIMETKAGLFFFLDTVEPGTHQGHYCGKRQAWLQRRLDQAGKLPVYLFMHHPPFKIGLKSLDLLAIAEDEALAELFSGYRNIKHLFFGHVHRPVAGSWCGIPFTTLRATNHQCWLDFNADAQHYPGSHEPPAYAVALLEEHQTIVHFHDYLDASPKFDLADPQWEGRLRQSED